jgi:hypothetical protein
MGNCKATNIIELYITFPQIFAELQICAKVLLGADELAALQPPNSMDPGTGVSNVVKLMVE